MPQKPKLGQNFLHDQNAIRRIVAALGDTSAQTVVEIGPGQGAITGILANQAACVIAIELDRELAPRLRSLLGSDRVTVLEQDVLQFDFAAAAAEARQKLAVVGNLPYYITSPILEKTAALDIPRAVFLIQKEVAQRLVAQPGERDYGFLTVRTALFAGVRLRFDVKPGAFHPPPKVDSAVVTLEPGQRDLGISDRAAFLEFVGLCFRHKRKSLRNNLVEAYGKEQIDAWPEARLRAEQISLEGFREMWQRVAPAVLPPVRPA